MRNFSLFILRGSLPLLIPLLLPLCAYASKAQHPLLPLAATGNAQRMIAASRTDSVTIQVAKGTLSLYDNMTWNSAAILSEEQTPQRYNVHITSAGKLRELLSEQIPNGDWEQVKELTITGAFAYSDLDFIQQLPCLTLLDMSGLDVEADHYISFAYNSLIETIVLPTSLTHLSSEAFYGCYGLKNIDLSKITTLEYRTFADCCSLDSVVLAEGLKEIPYEAFSGCSSLETITFPSTLKTIDEYAFYETGLKELTLPKGLKTIGCHAFENCASLQDVKVGEGVTAIFDQAFKNCTQLTEVSLPSTLKELHNEIFYGCDNLFKVTCKAVLPPKLTSPLFDPNTSKTRQLHVPYESSISSVYEEADYWKDFSSHWFFLGPIEHIEINQLFSINRPEILTGLPALHLYYSNADTIGHLFVYGRQEFALGDFSTDYYMYAEEKKGYYFPTFISNVPTSTANLSINVALRPQQWYFISFPFDLPVKDIFSYLPYQLGVYTPPFELPDEDIPDADATMWAIRKYSGKNRASGDGSTWLNMTSDSTLRAHEGYILQFKNQSNVSTYEMAIFTFSSKGRNVTIHHDTVRIQLKDYASKFSHNAGWNLIGNPFLCYYNTHELTSKSPITVWNGNGYTAYSPLDDYYVLSPLEAFFVQYSENDSVIGFPPSGQQNVGATYFSLSDVRTKADDARTVLNFVLADANYTDRARLVLNEMASLDYESQRDASKFMSMESCIPQLFLTENGVRYAIDERPLEDGEATMGAYFGTAGDYTLSLAANVADQYTVELFDKLTGRTTVLTREDYTFHAEPGMHEDRFRVTIKYKGTTGIVATDTSGVSVQAENGHINVAAQTAVPVVITGVDGRVVYRQTTANAEVKVNAGVYIVCIGRRTYKITVTE